MTNEPRQPDSQYGLTPQPFRLPTRNENVLAWVAVAAIVLATILVGSHLWEKAQATPTEWQPPEVVYYPPPPVATQKAPKIIACPKPKGYPHDPLSVADIQYIYGSSTGRCVLNG